MISARAFVAPSRQCLRRVRVAPSCPSPFSQVRLSLHIGQHNRQWIETDKLHVFRFEAMLLPPTRLLLSSRDRRVLTYVTSPRALFPLLRSITPFSNSRRKSGWSPGKIRELTLDLDLYRENTR